MNDAKPKYLVKVISEGWTWSSKMHGWYYDFVAELDGRTWKDQYYVSTDDIEFRPTSIPKREDLYNTCLERIIAAHAEYIRGEM